jgi:hypothetical protein
MTLVGTWNLVESENFEEFLKALGTILFNELNSYLRYFY